MSTHGRLECRLRCMSVQLGHQYRSYLLRYALRVLITMSRLLLFQSRFPDFGLLRLRKLHYLQTPLLPGQSQSRLIEQICILQRGSRVSFSFLFFLSIVLNSNNTRTACTILTLFFMWKRSNLGWLNVYKSVWDYGFQALLYLQHEKRGCNSFEWWIPN